MGKRTKFNVSKRQTPPPPSKQNIKSPLLENILSGMTFGVGSSLGHRSVDGVMGKREVIVNSDIIKNDTGIPCEKLFEVYQTCIEDDNNCKFWEDMIKSKCS